MYYLDYIVGIYFNSVSIPAILDGTVLYERFSQDEFADLAKAYIPQYSETEDRKLYEYIEAGAQEEGHPFAGMRERSGLNVFAALEELAEQLLVMENQEVLCKYRKLLRLRKVSEHIDEDLLVCAFLAARFKRKGKIYTSFSWNIAIRHDNIQLNRIMRRGLSENHFHLYGSAPSFHLLWIHFMNHVDDNALSQMTEDIERRQRTTRKHYSVLYREETFAVRILKAALIRIGLAAYLLEQKGHPVDFSDKLSCFLNMEDFLDALLTGQADIREYYQEIQSMIDRVRDYALLEDMGEVSDYICYLMRDAANVESEYLWIAGERWLLYTMLKQEITDQVEHCRGRKYYQWFYAYLVLKQSVRTELIQMNDIVGFENFAIYNRRKNVYFDADKMVKTAVHESLKDGNVKFLEMRITPCKSTTANARMLYRIDNIVKQQCELFSDVAYCYVFHFTKNNDAPLERKEEFDGKHCRHHRKRFMLKRQANGIAGFREECQEMASKVLGIDACSQEIGCRPEVFAPVFRFLSDHIVNDIPGVPKVCQLRKTYHVGEDFLDVVDGLRAVDEAIHFLNLKCGDRIGHGTVLGIDVRKWYEYKGNTIVLSSQDYLDNIVWLYHKLTEYKIDGADNLREKLLKEFGFYFAEIYLHTEQGTRTISYFTIDTYYEAWKLRGDEPELYIDGHYDEKKLTLDTEWFRNLEFPEKQTNRNREEIGYLYYLYHYDWDVRNNGQKTVQKYIEPCFIEGITAVQEAMQKDVASWGIGIETNPSSNLAISTFQEYAEHPIVRLYNKDITWDMERVKKCPQISVSINTDDKGVFHTSLENEYAYMACALEQERDEKGFPLYNRQMVYQWVDNIREMGNLQRFENINDKR